MFRDIRLQFKIFRYRQLELVTMVTTGNNKTFLMFVILPVVHFIPSKKCIIELRGNISNKKEISQRRLAAFTSFWKLQQAEVFLKNGRVPEKKNLQGQKKSKGLLGKSWTNLVSPCLYLTSATLIKFLEQILPQEQTSGLNFCAI